MNFSVPFSLKGSGTNIYFFTLQRFGPSPSRNFLGYIISGGFISRTSWLVTIEASVVTQREIYYIRWVHQQDILVSHHRGLRSNLEKDILSGGFISRTSWLVTIWASVVTQRRIYYIRWVHQQDILVSHHMGLRSNLKCCTI